MRHLVIGQRQKAPNFSAFHRSPHGCLVTISQHFVTTRVVHLPKRTETSLITESDQSRANHQLLQLCTVRIAWSDSDQAVWAVHSCKSWLIATMVTDLWRHLTQGIHGHVIFLDLYMILSHQWDWVCSIFSGAGNFCLAHGLRNSSHTTFKVTPEL